MNTNNTNLALVATLDGISTLAWLCLFIHNYRLKTKSIPVINMIIVLGISDLFYHVSNLTICVSFLTTGQDIPIFYHFVQNTAMRFSTFWGCSIALYVYFSVVTKITEPGVFFAMNFALSMGAALALGAQ